MDLNTETIAERRQKDVFRLPFGRKFRSSDDHLEIVHEGEDEAVVFYVKHAVGGEDVLEEHPGGQQGDVLVRPADPPVVRLGEEDGSELVSFVFFVRGRFDSEQEEKDDHVFFWQVDS